MQCYLDLRRENTAVLKKADSPQMAVSFVFPKTAERSDSPSLPSLWYESLLFYLKGLQSAMDLQRILEVLG